jgi:hypothetical protein
MRFLGKYELLEQLTVGKVETFAAYPIGGGERLLIHVFALPALIKSAPTNRDLLRYMEEISPPALGTLLDAGRYDDGSQAYVVTKFPRVPAALGTWVEAYKASVKSKHDTTAEVVPAELWQEGRSNETQEISIPEKRDENSQGEFTRAFQSVSAPRIPDKSPPTPVARPEPPVGPESMPTGEFFVPQPVRSPAPVSLTDQFMAGLGEGSLLGGTPEQSTPAKPEPFGNTAPFRVDSSDTWKKPSVTQSPEALSVGNSPPGEFTMFFKGPLAPPSGPSEHYPAEEPYSPAPARPSGGEFTQMFGAATPSASSPLPSEPLLEPVAQGDRFTDVFGKATVPLPEPLPRPNPAPEPPVSLEPAPGYVVSQNTNFPPPPLPPAAPEPMFAGSPSFGSSPPPGQSHDDNATRLFRTPVQDGPAPAPEPALPRESEYTRVISAKPQPAAAEKSAKPAAAGAGPSIKLSVPISPPPMPSLQPSAPHLAMPVPTPIHLPSVPAPKVPSLEIKVPPPAKGAEKKKVSWTSYVPLIVILNLLLLAAVGLVLYFIFAH